MQRPRTSVGLAIVLCCGAVATGGPALAAGPRTYAQRADRLCAVAGAKAVRISTRLPLAEQLKREAAIISALARRLRAITPPAAHAGQYRKFVAETRATGVDLVRALAAQRRNDINGYATFLGKALDAGLAADATATSLGLAACAKDYSPHGA